MSNWRVPGIGKISKGSIRCALGSLISLGDFNADLFVSPCAFSPVPPCKRRLFPVTSSTEASVIALGGQRLSPLLISFPLFPLDFPPLSSFSLVVLSSRNRLLNCRLAMTVVAELCSDSSASGAVVFVSKKLRITSRRIMPRSAPFGRCGFSVVTKNSYSRALVVTDAFSAGERSGGEELLAELGVLCFDRFGASAMTEIDTVSKCTKRHTRRCNQKCMADTVSCLSLGQPP